MPNSIVDLPQPVIIRILDHLQSDRSVMEEREQALLDTCSLLRVNKLFRDLVLEYVSKSSHWPCSPWSRRLNAVQTSDQRLQFMLQNILEAETDALYHRDLVEQQYQQTQLEAALIRIKREMESTEMDIAKYRNATLHNEAEIARLQCALSPPTRTPYTT